MTTRLPLWRCFFAGALAICFYQLASIVYAWPASGGTALALQFVFGVGTMLFYAAAIDIRDLRRRVRALEAQQQRANAPWN
jgi:hypothetical protein